MHESKQIVVSRGKCGDNQYHDMVHVYIAIINRPNIISFLGSMIAGVDCTRITIRHQARSIAFLHCADHVAVSLSRAFISNAFNLRVFSCEEKKTWYQYTVRPCKVVCNCVCYCQTRGWIQCVFCTDFVASSDQGGMGTHQRSSATIWL